jgi:hypothetical protein
MRTISLSNTLHEKILNCLSNDLSNFLIDTVGHAQAWTQSDQLAFLFSNYRSINAQPWGLRLTAIGNKLLSRHYKCYRYEHNDTVNHKVLVGLDKNMKWPYYLTRTNVVFYSEEDAAWFRLNDNSLVQYVSCI